MNRAKITQQIIENLSRCQRPAAISSWKKVGLSHAQVSLLYMLSFHKEANVKQIADYLGISNSAISQLVDSLAADGLVLRNPDSKDRRIIRLELSAKGRAKLAEVGKLKSAGIRTALSSLNGSELEQLYALCVKMAGDTLEATDD